MAPSGPLITALSTIRRNPKWTMTGRDNAEDKATMTRIMSAPGPGQYGNPKTYSFNRQPAALFGTGERDSGMSSTMQRPGPNQYNPQPVKASTMKASPMYRFPTSERVDEGMERGKRCRTPGPGAYDIKPMLDRMSPLMTSRRLDKIRSTTPGPGAYATPRELGGSKWGFGKAVRPDMSNGSQRNYPGPGNYPIPSALGGKNPLCNSMPRFTLTPRRPDDQLKNAKNTPGPGAHGGCYTTFGY